MALATWLPQQSRGPANWNSPQVQVPANVDHIHVHLLTTPAQFNTPAKSLTMAIEIDLTGAGGWFQAFQCKWEGASPWPTPPPGKASGFFAAVNINPSWIGLQSRVTLSQTGTFSWGLEGEIIRLG